MNSNKDAHGHIIYNYFKGLQSFDVVERHDGYVNVDDGEKLYFSEYKNWRRHEKIAIKYAHGRCLDIGCGAGRVLLHLQKEGLYALGIDSSPLAIKVCKLRGVKRARVMDIDDITKFRTNSFDSVIMFGNNFGLFGSKKKARFLLKKLYNITSNNALIIAEDRNPYITNNPVHFKYHKGNRKLGRMSGQLRIRIRFMQYSTPWYDYLYVSRNEMEKLLKGTGWKIQKVIKENNYHENGEYIAIIKKQPINSN